MSLDAEHLLAAIEAHPSSVREGTDSLVTLYGWRRDGGDPADFMAAIQSLVAAGLVAILPGPDMRLRLTAAGFARLDAALPEVTAEEPAISAVEDEAAWSGAVAGPVRETPAAELAAALRAVFVRLQLPAGHPVGAGSLSKIWAMERRRGGDLRIALDTLVAAGELQIARGARTTFALTEAGRAQTRAADREAP